MVDPLIGSILNKRGVEEAIAQPQRDTLEAGGDRGSEVVERSESPEEVSTFIVGPHLQHDIECYGTNQSHFAVLPIPRTGGSVTLLVFKQGPEAFSLPSSLGTFNLESTERQ